jgi:tetratricopeptide (TPR) repeat protein
VNSLPWARVKPVLDKALAAPAQDRDGILARACANDPELRREVEEYLRCQDFAGALLPATQWGTPAAAEDIAPPERVGPWRILREIGRGGMGVVYLAERDDGEYRQMAALKLVREARRNAAFEDLFRHERQVLAQLNHPGIARLLDGGATPEGRPYYVMEFVEGEPLTQYCRRLALPVRSRIRLLIQVCDAVSYAHRNLIVHRDLKPGNILVTARGEPKLLDFGLSKSLLPEPEGDLTATDAPLLTPAYASPEHLRGRHLTTASDLYSLGVILYELLAGCLPHDVQGQGLLQTCAAVCDQVPSPPSAAAPHVYRHAEDLDSIALKAIRKEPAERYPSVEAFAGDLELYLAGMPVKARRGNAIYRLRRFVSRHRLAVLGTTVAFTGMCISLGAVFWEQRQAALRFHQLRRFARAVVFELHDAIENLPGSTAARALLIQRSLEYLRSLEASSGRDLGLKWELAEAYKRVGDAQGDAAAGNLGDSTGALDSYARARSLLNQIAAARNPNVTTLKTLAAVASSTAGILLARGRQAEAVALRKEAVEALRQVALLSSTPEARKALALSHYNLAVGLTQVQNWSAAAGEWRVALALFEEIASSPSAGLAAQRNVALSHKRLAAVLVQQHDLTAGVATLPRSGTD